ncbi:MAG: hypothetical protein KA746_09445 [Pyrinomonadaceae bacterium]|nr:hypothetical protein [Pyrinomonadaceae bacterium]MBP6213698.1 hypothetical protein [Pyrinomonadaceae bacterium]
MKIETGETVLVVLRDPREKIVGIVNEIGPAGIQVRGIDLGYFDDWCNSIAAGEPHLPMTDYFFPMWRVERMTRDESGVHVASMTEQFNQRTGREIGEF